MKRQIAPSLRRLTAGLLTIALAFLLLSCSTDESGPAGSEPQSTLGTVTDIDGNEYRTVRIGGQLWMAENLRVTHFRNGSAIPNVTDEDEWSDLAAGAYCAYDNDPSEIATYGFLYNWYAVDDGQGLCPEGWHTPTDDDWKDLEMYLGMSQDEADGTGLRGTDEGGKLKATGTSHWQSPNTGATNESGFSAVPAGGRSGMGGYSGLFFYLGEKASLWTSSEHDTDEAWMRNLDHSNSYVRRRTLPRTSGLGVRCVRD